MSLEERVQAIEDRLAIFELLAAHPLASDTGDRALIEAIHTPGYVFDRGAGLDEVRGWDAMTDLVTDEQYRAAVTSGLTQFGGPPLISLDGDTATAFSYGALITPDRYGEPRELPRHGTSTGYRIHCIVINHWSLERTASGWRIAARTVRPADGTDQALALLDAAGRGWLS